MSGEVLTDATIALAVFTAVLAIATICYVCQCKNGNAIAKAANALAEKENGTAEKAFELQIIGGLFDAENLVADRMTALTYHDIEGTSRKRAFRSAEMARAGLYESACRYCLDGQLDGERFGTLFGAILGSHVQDGGLGYLYEPGSSFQATKAFVKKWESGEVGSSSSRNKAE